MKCMLENRRWGWKVPYQIEGKHLHVQPWGISFIARQMVTARATRTDNQRLRQVSELAITYDCTHVCTNYMLPFDTDNDEIS